MPGWTAMANHLALPWFPNALRIRTKEERQFPPNRIRTSCDRCAAQTSKFSRGCIHRWSRLEVSQAASFANGVQFSDHGSLHHKAVCDTNDDPLNRKHSKEQWQEKAMRPRLMCEIERR